MKKCPECGESFDPRGLAGHRAMAHGVSWDEQRAQEDTTGDGGAGGEQPAGNPGTGEGVPALVVGLSVVCVGAWLLRRSTGGG